MLTLNGSPIVEGVVCLPRVGAWHATLRVDAETAPTGRVSIDLDGTTYSGTIVRSGIRWGAVEVRVVGGAGGLSRSVPARYYRDVPARIVATDLIRGAGETLATSADPAALGTMLSTWTVAGGSAADALRHLLTTLNTSWRVLPDGTIWIGAETWPTQRLDHEVVDVSPAEGWSEVWSERLSLMPGVTLDGQRVSYVEHHIAPRRIRTRFWIE